MNQISASQFKHVYDKIGYSAGERGCIMLDTEPIIVSDVIAVTDLWADDEMAARGNAETPTSELEPHVTLLYGLQHSGPEMKVGVDGMLEGWTMPISVEILSVDFFYGNPDEPNVAIVAKLYVSNELLEGNKRLKQLMHIDTYPEYEPHITLAYVKDSADYKSYVEKLNLKLKGQAVMVTGLNYGH